MYLPSLPRKLLTLAFVVRGPGPAVRAFSPRSPAPSAPQDVLLGLKKRGFGQGKWNGFGGKVEPTDASIAAAAAREVAEEALIRVRETDLHPRGILMFTFDGAQEILEVHVFVTDTFEGEPAESDEMRPQWYTSDAMPYDCMWEDDRIWLPHVLDGKVVHGHFHFDKDENTMLEHELHVTEVESETM